MSDKMKVNRENIKLVTNKVKKDFDEIAFHYDKLNSFSRCYDKLFIKLLPTARLDILDVGAGIGEQAESTIKIRPFDKWTLLDISSNMISMAQNRLRDNPAIVEFVVGDFLSNNTNLPLKKYNVVIVNKVLHDYPDIVYLKAIRVLCKYLKKKGLLIIGDVTSSRKGVPKYIDLVAEFFWRLRNMKLIDFVRYYLFPMKTTLKVWKNHIATEPKLTMPVMQKLLQGNFTKSHFKKIHPHYFLFCYEKEEF